LSWSFGLRGGNEPAELKRSDVKVEPGPKLRFHLDKSKADQDRIGADFGMTADTEGKRALLRAVVRWVAVWDSCQPDPAFDGPLFCTFTSRNGGDPRLSKSRQMTSNRADFRRLAVLAGLEPNWTPHSTRAGYAVTAVDDGHSLTTVSRAMRHSNVRTTETYLAHAGDQGHAAVRSIFRPGNDEPKEAN
jgi:integrase